MPPEVVQDDVEYARPEGCPLLARIYRPPAVPPEPRPLLVDVHGGAWTYFNREVDWYFDSALAADGMVVVALDFRQAPTPYPAAVADVVAGIRWAKAHARALGARATGSGARDNLPACCVVFYRCCLATTHRFARRSRSTRNIYSRMTPCLASTACESGLMSSARASLRT